jgi:hypothetical protein
MEQLAEQLADPRVRAMPADEAGALFRLLPPAGLIPRDAIDLAGAAAANQFFPPTFGVDAVPIPLEQLDLALEASAALASLDAQKNDYVRVLVPVPGHLYEPRLLLSEQIDAIFGETIARFRQNRDRLLARREQVRVIAALYAKALENRDLSHPDDKTADDEAPATEPLDPAEGDYGTEIKGDQRVITRYEALRAELDKLPGKDTVKDPAGTVYRLGEIGLRAFVGRMREQLDAADDQIDIGFLRIQTDIYRVRQLVLGTDVAAKLVTSSALAAIVKDETSSLTTREALRDYVLSAKGRVPQGGVLGEAAPETPGAGTLGGGFNFQPQDLARNVSRAGIAARLGAGAAAASAADRLAGAELASGLKLGDAVLEAGSRATRLIGQTSAQLKLAQQAGLDLSVLRPPRPDDIQQQQPLPGAVPVFRDTTIGQRLQLSSAEVAKDNTRATHVEIVEGLSNYDIFSDIRVPFVEGYDGGRVSFKSDTIRNLKENLGRLIDIPPPGADEVGNFNAGIDSIDVAVGALRAAEARLRALRDTLRVADDALGAMERAAGDAGLRLSAIGDGLAEARHDVAVAVALRDEEQARLDAINSRREQILRDAVGFLAYVRPRTTEISRAAPSRRLDPAATAPAIPACLQNPQTVPAELRAFVDLLRDVPLRWLARIPALLDRLDRIELLQDLLATGVSRAAAPARSHAALFGQSSFSGGLGLAIARTYVAQQGVAASHRAALARFDAGELIGRTWRQVRDAAADLSSLDDLVASGHGASEVARRALEELDDIGQVAACLHAGFAAVRPALRLQWAEILSVYDDPIDLRSLARLPSWGEIEIVERRALQGLVDWLYSAVDPGVAGAVALMSDLVRVCVLLASHAPVGQLITARVAQAAPLQLGGRLALKLDLPQARVGMQVLLYDRADASRVVARAVIDDLHAGGAAARVTYAARPNLQVSADDRVVLTAAGELQRLKVQA